MTFDKTKGMAAFRISESLYDEMLTEFVAQADREIRDIRNNMEAGKWTEMGVSVHSLKGTAGNLRLEDCFQFSKEFEQLLRTHADGDYAKALAHLESAVDEIRQVLRKPPL